MNTLEQDKEYEDYNDLVLVQNKDDEKQVTEEKSLSPDARD